MRTSRDAVFETNSSSTHCLTVNEGMRDKNEFPPIEDGIVHIPLSDSHDIDKTNTFVKLVQYIVLMTLEEHGYEYLFKIPESDVMRLRNVIEMAYRMAGFKEDIDEIVFDPPKRASSNGIVLTTSGAILWDVFVLDIGVLADSLNYALECLHDRMSKNNTAVSLVKWYGDPADEVTSYAAAALAMNTSGYFIET